MGALGMTGTGPSITDIITAAAQKYGVAPWVAVDIAQVESSLNPNSVGDNGTSFGLFQLHYGGQGDGYTVGQLENPFTNADVGVSHMTQAYQQGVAKGLQGYNLLDYTATHSGHPGYGGVGAYPAYESQLRAVYSNPPAGGGSTTVSGTSISGTTSATAPGKDVISVVDNALTIKNFSISSPLQSMTQDAAAITLRAFLFIVGLLVIAFGLARLNNA